MDVSDVMERYLLFKATHASPCTIKTDKVLFRQFCRWSGSRAVEEGTSEDVRGYLEYHTKRGLSPYTIRRHHAVLSALYGCLTSPGIALTTRKPVASVSPPRLPKRKAKALAKDEITAILKAADLATCKRRARALILFPLDTGARASEVAHVKLADVTWNDGKVKVTGKGKKERFVYLGQRALSSLWLYVKEERPEPRRVGDDHLFLTHEGYSMDRHTLRCVFRRLSARAGVKASPHQFRHSAAVEHLRHGMDLVSL